MLMPKPATPSATSMAPAPIPALPDPDRIATPATTSPIEGSVPKTSTLIPIEAIPPSCPPQRSRKSPAERLSAAIGPRPSSATTGRARKVTRLQAPPKSLPMIWAISPRDSSARITSDTVAVRSAQPAMARRRVRATPKPYPSPPGSPRSARSAAATRATPKKVVMKAAA